MNADDEIAASCPNCFEAISAADLAKREGSIACPSCGSVLDLLTGDSPPPMPVALEVNPPPLPKHSMDDDVICDDGLVVIEEPPRPIGRSHASKTQTSRKPLANPSANMTAIWIGLGVAVAIVAAIAIIFGGALDRGDPNFDRIEKGMSEDEVVRLLGTHTWMYHPGGVGIWAYPRMTNDEYFDKPELGRQLREQIFVYFHEHKVVTIFRVSGEEFRMPRRK